MPRHRHLLLVPACLLALASAHAQTVTNALPFKGDWAGSFTMGTQTLRLVLHIHGDSAAQISGTLDSIDQGAYQIALANLHVTGLAENSARPKTIAFDAPLVQGHYEGTLDLNGNNINGNWNQGTPAPYTLNFSRQSAFVAAPTPGDLDGNWLGVVQPGGNIGLRLILHIRTDATGAAVITVDSPEQLLSNLATSNAHYNSGARTLAFDLPAAQGHYSGTLGANHNTITGTWTQGQDYPLNFQRAGNLPPSPPTFVQPQPGPVQPNPVQPNPAQPNPAGPGSGQPAPAGSQGNPAQPTPQ